MAATTENNMIWILDVEIGSEFDSYLNPEVKEKNIKPKLMVLVILFFGGLFLLSLMIFSFAFMKKRENASSGKKEETSNLIKLEDRSSEHIHVSIQL